MVFKFTVNTLRQLFGTWSAQEDPSIEDQRIKLVREVVRLYRRGLAGRIDRTKSIPAERLNRRRYSRRKASELNRAIKKGRRPEITKDVLIARYRTSPLLDVLLPERKERWVLAPRRGATPPRSITLTDFSIIDHPAKTMEALFAIADAECVAPSALLHFDDEYCVDIAPYLVLEEMWPGLTPIFRGGRMSIPIQKVVAAVNLHRPLHMSLTISNTKDVWAFPLKVRRIGVERRAVPQAEPQRKEQVADDFCDALDDWLNTDGLSMELTPNGRAAFATIITELLDNAERHSSPTEDDEFSGNWSCAAFMARRHEGDRVVYRCHMGFLSVGASIAESLRLGPPKRLADARRYVNKHSLKGLSEEALTTVYALQDGITRIHEAAAEKRGGIGFQELLKFVSVLSDGQSFGSDARLTVISGNTCIQLKKPYVQGVSAGLNKPRLIWFNSENDPDRPPSKDHVFDLPRRFGGTVVGISFVLDHDYLKANLNDRDQSSGTDEPGSGEKPGGA